MSGSPGRRFALVALPIVIVLVVVGQTDLVADDRLFYGLIALFIVSQVAWWVYLARRTRQEEYSNALGRLFDRD